MRVVSFAALGMVALVLVTVGGSTAARAPLFRSVDLGTLGGETSEATAVSNSGQIVGSSATASGATHAFSWTPGGGMIDLGTLGGSFSSATAVSDAGQVVGSSTTQRSEMHAFSWTQADGMLDLGPGAAVALNESGQVVGQTTPPDATPSAFLWTKADGLISLGTLGGASSFARDINEQGQAVGEITMVAGQSGSRRGFSWTQSGGMVEVGTLAGDETAAVALNDAGEVVGYSRSLPFSLRRAFMWTAGNGMVALAGGNVHSVPTGINEAGQVVGAFASASSANEGANPVGPWSWTRASGLRGLPLLTALDLNDAGQAVGSSRNRRPSSWTASGDIVELDPRFGSAQAVNNAGVVVGRTVDPSGRTRATMWAPTTRPSKMPTPSASAGDGQAVVTFATALDDGGVPVTHYTAIASPGGRSASGTGSPITVDGMTNGTSYTFVVAATNGVGTGSPSAPSNAVVPVGPERPHPEPPAEDTRVDAPAFTPPGGPRPGVPAH